MKTPIQEHIQWLKKEYKKLESMGELGIALHIGDCIQNAESLLEKEKEASHIGVVTKRLNWMVKEMDKAKPFSQSYNNLNDRHSRLLEAKKIFDKEGLWL